MKRKFYKHEKFSLNMEEGKKSFLIEFFRFSGRKIAIFIMLMGIIYTIFIGLCYLYAPCPWEP